MFRVIFELPIDSVLVALSISSGEGNDCSFPRLFGFHKLSVWPLGWLIISGSEVQVKLIFKTRAYWYLSYQSKIDAQKSTPRFRVFLSSTCVVIHFRRGQWGLLLCDLCWLSNGHLTINLHRCQLGGFWNPEVEILVSLASLSLDSSKSPRAFTIIA